jgi:hypothetical protein
MGIFVIPNVEGIITPLEQPSKQTLLKFAYSYQAGQRWQQIAHCIYSILCEYRRGYTGETSRQL